MTIAEKLRNLMERCGLSQTDLAERVGTYQAQVSKWVNGDAVPSLPLAFKAARALGVPLDFLADDAQDVPPAPEVSDDERFVLTVIRDLELSRSEVVRRLNAPASGRWVDLTGDAGTTDDAPGRARRGAG